MARPHIRGISAQRKLAISRAIEDVAMQMGVKIKTVQKKTDILTDKSVSTSFSSYSVYMVDGRTVQVSVKQFWEDPKTKELYVWVVQD